MTMLLSNYTAALKEVVMPFLQNNFPSETILLDNFKKNVDYQFINDEFIAPVWTSRHGGIANLANDGNNVVSASGRTSSRATVPVETVTGAFNISRLAIEASATSKGAVAAALTSQSQTLSSDFARHINRQIYGDGVGVVAETIGSSSATNIELAYPTASLDDGRSVDWYGTVNGDISPTKYLAVDQILGFGTGGADLGTVTAVNGGTSVTVTGNPAWATNDSVYIMDGSGQGAGTSEFLGIRAALSSSTGTSTYAGLARNTTGWTPQFGSALEALTQDRLDDSYLSAREYARGSDKFIILVNKSLYKKYGKILTSMRRTVNETKLLGGFTGLEYAAGGGVIGVFVDYDVPDGEVLIIDLDSWKLCQVRDLDWLESGGELLRLQNTITYQAVMVWFANVMTVAPAANGRQTQKQD